MQGDGHLVRLADPGGFSRAGYGIWSFDDLPPPPAFDENATEPVVVNNEVTGPGTLKKFMPDGRCRVRSALGYSDDEAKDQRQDPALGRCGAMH